MSNVTGEAVEDVSSYMTAIWNNFDGTYDQLERYADVITALGAATASSSEEIAGGLEQFASIAETVGLSYEYATSALATVVSTTRQSESVVGTSFKTIFSRLQGLSLGETLDDGVDLNKYSTALHKVGVEILDTSGNMKDLDTILDDLGAKWETLSSAQKTALAQTVAGTRQYNQLISLMDNWDVMKANLVTAENSEGALQEQADIYAESWEAARKRVQTSAQAIYSDLIDDEFFIDLTDGFANLLTMIDKVIDGIGGLRGVLLAAGSVILKLYGNQIAHSLENVGTFAKSLTKTGRAELEDRRQEANKALMGMYNDQSSPSASLAGEAYKSQASIQQTYLENAQRLTAEQQKQAQLLMDQHGILVQCAADQQKVAQAAQNSLEVTREMASLRITATLGPSEKEATQKTTEEYSEGASQFTASQKLRDKFLEFRTESDNPDEQVSNLISKIKNLKSAYKEDLQIDEVFGDGVAKELDKVLEKLEKIKEERDAIKEGLEEGQNMPGFNEDEVTDAFSGLNEIIGEQETNLEKIREGFVDKFVDKGEMEALKKLREEVMSAGGDPEDLAILNELEDGIRQAAESSEGMKAIDAELLKIREDAIAAGTAMEDLSESTAAVEGGEQETSKRIRDMVDTKGLSEGLTTLVSGLASFASIIVTVKSSFEAINSEDTSFLEKVNAAIIGFSSAVPQAIFGIKDFGKGVVELNVALGLMDAQIVAGTKGIGAWAKLLAKGLVSLLPAIATIAFIGVSVYAVVKAFQAWEEAGKSTTTALNEATAAAQDAATAANDAATAYSDLQTTLEELSSSADTISELERGTSEWREAILEANSALMELLSTYGMLSSDNYTINSDGLMTITKEAQETILKQAEEKSIAASSTNYAMQIKENNAALYNTSATSLKEAGLKGGVFHNDALVANIGTAIGEALSSGTITSGDLNNADVLSEYLDNNTSLTDGVIEKAVEKITSTEEVGIELRAALSELGEEVNANTEANRILNDQIVDSNFGEDIDNSGLSGEGQEALSALMGAALSDKTESYRADHQIFGEADKKAAREAYAIAKGYQTTDINGKGDSFDYVDSLGNTIEDVSDTVVQTYLAQQDAIAEMQGNVTEYIEIVNGLMDIGNKASEGGGEALATFAGGNGGDLSSLTESQKESFVGSVDSKNKTIGGDEIDSDMAASYGYDTVKEFFEAIEAASNAYDERLDNLKENWYRTVQTLYDGLDTEDLSLSARETLGDTLNEAFENMGEGEFLNTFMNSFESQDLEEFSSVLGEMDWDTASVSDFKSALTEAGVNLDNISDGSLSRFIDSLKTTGSTLDEVIEKYSTEKSIVEGLSDGDSISSDDYNKLSTETQAFFSEMLDGTYQLKISAEELNRIVHDTAMGDAKQLLNESINKASTINQVDGEEINQQAVTGTTGSTAGGVIGALSNALSGSKLEGNDELLQKQIDLLGAMSDEIGVTEGQLSEWQTALEGQQYDKLQDVYDYIQQIDTSEEGLNSTLQEVSEEIQAQMTMVGGACQSFNELNGLLAEGTINEQAWGESLDAVTSTMAEAYDLDFDDIVDQGKALAKTYDLDTASARSLAVQNQRMNKGVSNLVDNWSDWKKALKSTDKTQMDYIDGVQDLTSCIADLVGASENLELPDDFFESKENLDLIAKAAKGSEDAINMLGLKVAESSVKMLDWGDAVDAVGTKLETSYTDSSGEEQSFSIKENEFIAAKATVINGIQEMQDSLDSLKVGDNVFESLGGDEWVTALNEMAMTTEMSVEEMNSLLNSMGVEAEVVTEHKETPVEVPQYTTYTVDDGAEPLTDPETGETRYYQRTKTITNLSGYTTMKGYVDVAQINVGEDNLGKTPKNITYTGNGTVSNAAKKGTKKSSGSKGSSGSGSKGSSGSKKSKDKIDKKKDERDIYHDIKEAIEEVEHEVSILDKKESHLAGNELAEALAKKNKLLKQQSENYAEYSNQISDRQDQIAKYMKKKLGVDVSDYDATYTAILKRYNSFVKKYNAYVKKYNKMSASDQEKAEKTMEKWDKKKEKADDIYSYFTNLSDEWQENQDQLRENEEKKTELLYEQIENNLSGYEATIEVALDVEDAKRTLKEFLKDAAKSIGKTFKLEADWTADFSYFKDSQASYKQDYDTYEAQVKKYKEALAGGDWGKDTSLFGSKSELEAALREATSNMISSATSVREAYEEGFDELTDFVDECIDKFESLLDQIESVNDSLDHYSKINELLNGEDTTKSMQIAAQIYEKSAQTSLLQQKALKKHLTELKNARDEAEKSELLGKDSEIYRTLTEEISNAQAELESTIEDYLETIQDEVTNAINLAKDSMDRAMLGSTISDVQQDWEDRTAQAEGYYDQVERIYQIESLESKWQSAINSASSLKNQKQLKSLMEAQVSALEEKTALSEKDVELAEKEIEVYQAQMALEEAQNSKNSMKLVRDESGNWSYQYIADADNVADKQQNLLDKTNEWRQAAVSAAEEINQSIVDAYSNFSERMIEIESDLTLSDEERAEKIEALTEMYYGEDGIITKAVEDSNYVKQEANEATMDLLWSLYETDVDKYDQMTEKEKALIDSVREQGVASYSSLIDFIIGSDGQSGAYGDILDTVKTVNEDSSAAWKSMAADAITSMYGKDGKLDSNSVTAIVKKAYNEMEKALSSYDQKIAASEESSGESWSNVATQVDKTSEAINEATFAVNDFNSGLDTLSTKITLVQELKEAWDEVALAIRNATNAQNETSTSESESTEPYSDRSSLWGNGQINQGDKVTFTGVANSNSKTKDEIGEALNGVTAYIDKKTSYKSGDRYPIHLVDADGNEIGWAKKSQISGYDTGGYTGEWGDNDGRLAVLHSKELVLNQEDTSNMLSAVKAVRDISSLGSSVASSISNGIGNMIKGLLNLTPANYSGTTNTDSEVSNNTFEITMNVDGGDVEEIKSAILSLPNLASQYLSRNKK